MNNTVTITKEDYLRLKLCEEKLGFLEGAGVDNWEGYSDALNPEGEESYSDVKKRLTKEIMENNHV